MTFKTFQEQKNREALFKLIQENPELPVVPMVDSAVVADDSYGSWLGHWGAVRKDAYLITDERVLVRDYDDEEDVLSAIYGWDTYSTMSDEEAREAYDDIEWTEAIIVHIIA